VHFLLDPDFSVVGNWKFKPEISGVFTIPINYKRQA
jgi:hypothetical protein